jgi:hypothetical protein
MVDIIGNKLQYKQILKVIKQLNKSISTINKK